MAVNVKNAFVAKPMDAGTAFSFPSGAFSLPTSAMTPLAPGILATDHGAVDEDGFSVSVDRTNADFNMFGGGRFISAQTEYKQQVKITFLEDENINVLKTAFGEANVVREDATDEHGTRTAIYYTDDELPIKSWVVQAQYRGRVKRQVVEFARVATVGEIKSTHKEPTKWEITLDVYLGSDGRYTNEYREEDDKLEEVTYAMTISGTPTGGDFTLKVAAEESAAIAYNVTGPNVKAALEALAGVVSATVTLSGGTYTIKLVARGGLSVGSVNLTGGTDPTVTVVAA